MGGTVGGLPSSTAGRGLNGTPVERSQIGAWPGRHHGYAGSGGEKTVGRRCRRAKLSRGDRSLARTWARLDGGREMRNRERERWGTVGGSACAPWLDVVGVTVETHVQTLADRRTHSRSTWPTHHSAINGMATASTAMCARHPTNPEAQCKDDVTAAVVATS